MTAPYRDGFPDETGWYECLADGEPVRLLFYFCRARNRPHWVYPGGNSHGGYFIEDEAKVLYRPGKLEGYRPSGSGPFW